MSSYQQTVDELRTFVQGSDLTHTDPLKEQAVLYAAACREVNQRLSRCMEFLKKGLRSEAIHLAQAEPPLLDAFVVLDFPERPLWEEIAAMYGWAAPPALLLDAARALNEAYAEEQPLEDLMRRHRLLALSKAPLVSRLQVLRRVAQLDTLNPIWAEDVRTFEKARFREMQHEVEEAARLKEPSRVVALAEELRCTRWSVEPPGALMHHAESIARRHAAERTRAALLQRDNELNAAINAFDLPRARALRGQIWDLLKDAGIGPGDPLWERVGTSLNWVDEQDRRDAETRQHEKTIRELESALDEHAPREELEQLLAQAQQNERGLSKPLEERCRARLRDLEGAVRRKRRLVFGAVAVGLLLVVVLSTWLVQRSLRASRVNETVNVFDDLLRREQVQEARTRWDRLVQTDPGLTDTPELAKVRGRLEEAEKKESRRRLLFEEALKDLKAATSEDARNKARTRANELVRLPEEEAAVQAEARAGEERTYQAGLRRDQTFRQRVEDLDRRLDEVERLLARPRNETAVQRRLDELQPEVDRLTVDTREVSRELRDAVPRLAGRLQTARRTLASRQGELQIFDQLTAALASAESAFDYAELLNKYGKQYPGTERVSHFQRAAQERDIWQGVLTWNLVMGPHFQEPLRLDHKAAKALAQKCREFLDVHPNAPDAATVREYLQVLTALALRDPDNSDGVLAGLRKIFSDHTVQRVWAVRTADGGTSYVTRDPSDDIESQRRNNGKSILLPCLENYTPKPGARTFQVADIRKVAPARQSVHAQDVLVGLGKIDKSWEEATLAITRKLLADDDMDPLVQLRLFERLTDCAAKGSYPLALALAGPREHLRKASVDTTVLWMNPINAMANGERPKAQAVVRQLRAMPVEPKAVEEQRRNLETRIERARHQLAGWLLRDAVEGWYVRPVSGLPRAGELYVAVPRGGQPAEWRRVGKLAGGKAVVETNSAELLVEGRLLFARGAEAR